MSFGYSVSDAVLLVQLAWKTVQNSRKACGEHDELTQEISSLHVVLRRLELEVRRGDSPINRPEDTCQEELQIIASGCQKVLDVLDKLLEKYNTLGWEGRGAKKLWQRIQFGNGEMTDLGDLRGKLVYYTSAMSLFLNMVAMGSIGRVEKQMDEAGGDLKGIKLAVNCIAGFLASRSHHEGSALTAYGNDDRAVWKEFRRELLKGGFSSSVLQKHKATIKAYVTELGERGLFDEEDTHLNNGREHHAVSMSLVDHANRVTSLPLDTVIESDKTKIALEAKQSQSSTAELDPSADIVELEVDAPLVREASGEEYTTARTPYEARSVVGPHGSIIIASPSLTRASSDTAVLPTLNMALRVAGPDLSPSVPGELRENHVLEADNARTVSNNGTPSLQPYLSKLKVGSESHAALKSGHTLLRPTPIKDFHDISRIFWFDYKPQCERLISEAANQPYKSDSFPERNDLPDERKRLSECIRGDVLNKLDSFEAGYDEEFEFYKRSLIQEVQAWLTALDETEARSIPSRPPRDSSSKRRCSSGRPMVPRISNPHSDTSFATSNFLRSPISLSDRRKGERERETMKSLTSLLTEYWETQNFVLDHVYRVAQKSWRLRRRHGDTHQSFYSDSLTPTLKAGKSRL